MRLDTIVGYTFKADLLGPLETAEAVARTVDGMGITFLGIQDWETVEEYLDRVANLLGIERLDEWTFDSDDFPKVVFADMVSADEAEDLFDR